MSKKRTPYKKVEVVNRYRWSYRGCVIDARRLCDEIVKEFAAKHPKLWHNLSLMDSFGASFVETILAQLAENIFCGCTEKPTGERLEFVRNVLVTKLANDAVDAIRN